MLYWVDSAGSPTYRLTDGLGSTVALANASGAVTDTYTYDVFGAIRSHSGASTTEFTFTGEQNDPNGLEYLRARYYDPGTGRFLSRDPLGGGYPYAGANPVNMTDPTGLYPIDYTGLTERELRYCGLRGKPWERAWSLVRHGAECSTIADVRNMALESASVFAASQGISNEDGTLANAYQHCVGAALLTIAMGRKDAERALARHEDDPGNPEDHRQMDEHNNSVGVSIGEYCSSSQGHYERAARLADEMCRTAAISGMLKVLR